LSSRPDRGDESKEETMRVSELIRQIDFEEDKKNLGDHLLLRRAARDDIKEAATLKSNQEKGLTLLEQEYHPECEMEQKYAESFGYSLLAGVFSDPGACVIDLYNDKRPILTTVLVPEKVASRAVWYIRAPYLLTLFGDGEFWHPRSKIPVSLKSQGVEAKAVGFANIAVPLSKFKAEYFFTAAGVKNVWKNMKTDYELDCVARLKKRRSLVEKEEEEEEERRLMSMDEQELRRQQEIIDKQMAESEELGTQARRLRLRFLQTRKA